MIYNNSTSYPSLDRLKLEGNQQLIYRKKSGTAHLIEQDLRIDHIVSEEGLLSGRRTWMRWSNVTREKATYNWPWEKTGIRRSKTNKFDRLV
jgi:hypothetical protein